MKSVIILLVLCSCDWTNGANILCFFPVPFRSHYAFAEPFLEKLAERGHNLTAYTIYPDTSSSLKYRQVDISACIPPQQEVKGKLENIMAFNMMSFLKMMYNFLPKSSEDFLKCAPLNELFKSTDQFDLFVTDISHRDWYAGFAYKFGCPMISVFPNTAVMPWLSDTIGAISNPAFVTHYVSNVCSISKMPFADRLFNTYVYLMMQTIGLFYTTIPAEKFAREVFGDEMPTLKEIVKNTSVTFFNHYPGLNAALPLPPNLIQVGGMNVRPAKVLPEVSILFSF